ncbi:MAG: N-acetylmuramoyl-L-alanine amidase [Terriglobales bacterium]
MSITTTYKTLAIVLLLCAATSAAPPATNQKQLSVYAPVATYTLPVLERSGHDYVGLLELLEPLGRVSSGSSNGRWRIRYDAVDGDFTAGKIRSKIRGRDLDLTAPFLIENARGLVPLASLGGLLPRFLGTPVNFHEGGRRLFIGNVGIQPSFLLEPGAQPRLVVNFSAPVNPTVSTEPGRLRMVFKHDPVLSPASQQTSFPDQVITQAAYSENNGIAELDVSTNSPLLATFSNGGKTITLATAPEAGNAGRGATPGAMGSTNPSSARTASATSAAAKSGGTTVGASSGIAGGTSPAVHRMLAFVDAAHGGDERGATLSDTLAEKDVTLGFARLLRHELELHGFAVLMSRDADTTVSLDQRAGAANAAQAAVYITLHATSQGDRSGVYTALLPRQDASKGIFQAWNAAQAPALPVSQAVATAVVAELQKRNFPARASSASLRPLNNVSMPAIAVELAPGSNGLTDLASATYQQQAAEAIADAVFSVRDRLGAQQ